MDRPTQTLAAALYREHSVPIRRSVYRWCGSTELADDVTSETFAAATQLLKKGVEVSLSRGWLVTVARRRLVDSYRARERELRLTEKLARQQRSASEEPVDDDGSLHLLRALPPRQAHAIAMRLGGYSVSEVALELGTSYRAAESLLARARHNLAREIQTTRQPKPSS